MRYLAKMDEQFESLVSFEGCKTTWTVTVNYTEFESLVSFEGCKTVIVLPSS